MSYQSIETNITKRFFTVLDRSNGDPIISGTVNYYLKAKSGTNDGLWWRDSDESWQNSEIANLMSHDADGHWEIDLSSSPFDTNGVRFLEYVKESDDLHIPDSRHLIARDELTQLIQADNIKIAATLTAVQALDCVDTNAIIAAIIIALADLQLNPERTILGPCKQKLISSPQVIGQRC